jgi:hypothetical protein
MKIKDVHTEHCCLHHGCKYGENETCTVMSLRGKQSYLCEGCKGYDKKSEERINRMYQEAIQFKRNKIINTILK